MRSDVLKWDDYFMSVAILSAMKSKDPNTQVGACIVNELNIIIGAGYNGFPKGIDDTSLPWEREGEFLNTKYPYVVHAEPNAILNSSTSVRGSRIYVTLFPCNECAKFIIQSGIVEIIFMEDKYACLDNTIASKKLLDAAGVTYRQMNKLTLTVEKE